MRIGLLFRALGAVAVLANADPLTELNYLRAANGIPAGISENPAWSAGCAQHMNYLELQRLRRRLAHRGARAPGLQRRGQGRRPGAPCSPTPPRSGSNRTGRPPRFTSRSCSRRSSRCPASVARLHLHLAGLHAARAAHADALHLPRRRRGGRDDARTCTCSASAAGRRGHAQRRVADGPGRPGRGQRHRQPHRGRRGLSPAGRHPLPRGSRSRTTPSTPPRSRSPPTRACRRSGAGRFSTGELGAADRAADRRGRPRRQQHRQPAAERAHAADDARAASRPARRRPRDGLRPGRRRRPHRARHRAAHWTASAGRPSGRSG